MRRSGSSSCLLRPKSDILEGDKMSVTLLNTTTLPTYSTERFYMLSELELHAHSTTFLCDDVDVATLDTVESSEASFSETLPNNNTNIQQQQQQSSLYSILYILWRPDQASMSPRAFCHGTIASAIQQYKTSVSSSTTESSTTTMQEEGKEEGSSSPSSKETETTPSHLYLVVDIAASPNEQDTTSIDTTTNEQVKKRRFQVKVDTAERLARYVSQQEEFRFSVEGITVGISNHSRAAPGLEACLDTILYGARDRRKLGPQKSHVGLVVLHPDDLIGYQDEAVTDAAQGVLQARTCAEWNGNGNMLSFGKRAHAAWCISNNIEQTKETSPPRQGRRRRAGDLDGDFAIDFMDPFMTCLIIFFFGYVLSHLWIMYYAEAVGR